MAGAYWNNLRIPAESRDCWGYFYFQRKTMCSLYVLNNLESHTYEIGTDEKCNIVLKKEDIDGDYSRISPRHFSISKAKLESGPEYVILKNLSSNGTIISNTDYNTHLTKYGGTCVLEDGDTIWMARMAGNDYFIFKNKREGQSAQSDSIPLILKKDLVYLKNLGQGGYGKVILALKKLTNKPIAVKMTRHPRGRSGHEDSRCSRRIIRAGINECKLLWEIKHPNIIKTYDFNFNYLGNTLYMFMEYAAHGDLSTKLVEETRFSEETNKHIFKQLLQALRFLHSIKIAHRDLKPENVLIKTPGPKPHILLTDFGLSIEVNSFSGKLKSKHVFGTYPYMAPEIVSIESGTAIFYNVKVDIWSFGVMLYQCIFGRHPFQSCNMETQMKRIGACYFFMPPTVYEHTHAIKMINDSTIADMDRRASADQLLKSRWFGAANSSTRLDMKPESKPILGKSRSCGGKMRKGPRRKLSAA